MFDQTDSPEDDFEDVLTALGIDIVEWGEAFDAERDFPEYLLAVAVQDLYIAGALHSGQEVVNIATRWWPLPTDINNTNGA